MLADFYSIKIGEERTTIYECEVTLNPAHAIYEGHFPGFPVTPGVCLLHIIKDCASQIRNTRLRYGQISSCKFLSVVNPLENNQLHVKLEFGDNDEVRAFVGAEDKSVLKLKAKLINT